MDRKRINQLINNVDTKRRKYTYNLWRYLNDTSISLDSFNNNSVINTFAPKLADTVYNQADYNIIRSCVDSLVSKISANKVRPYIHPLNGTYSSRLVDKKLRQFFDFFLTGENLSAKIIDAFRQALIFDSCYLFIDPWTYEIKVLPPYNVGFDYAEIAYGKPTEMVIKYNNYPATLLEYKTEQDYVQYVIAISTIEHKAYRYINGELVDSTKYNADVLPYTSIYYEKPVNGLKTIGMADALEGIQEQLDIINAKISAANELTPATITFVAEGSSLNKHSLNNKTGAVYSVKVPEGVSSIPVATQTPIGFDMALIQQKEHFIKSAYEMTGISQLSAQAKKPAGVDSGVAMATLADLESERFQQQYDNYIQSYQDITKLIIQVMPDNANILPEDYSSLKWKDAKQELSKMRISFGSDSILSKEPQKKMEQINQISAAGMADMNDVIQQLDSTDLESMYRDIGAKINSAEAVITNAVENGVYTIPQYVSYEELKKRILTEENAISSNTELTDDAVIELLRLQSLETVLDNIIETEGAVHTQEQDAMTADNGLTGLGNNDIV